MSRKLTEEERNERKLRKQEWYRNAYATNHNGRRENAVRWATEGRNRKRLLVWNYLLEHPCIDCGESDPVVLEFDHRDPSTKAGAISQLVQSHSWENVALEIAKCDIRCANCHRRKTTLQFGWTKVNFPK